MSVIVWDALVAVGFVPMGYALAGGAFGLRGRSPVARVAWSLALGAVIVALLVPVVLVLALSGGLPRIESISLKVWAFAAGAGVAALTALYRARGDLRRWAQGGGIRRASNSVAGAVVIELIGFGVAKLAGGDSAERKKPAAEAAQAVPAVVAAAAVAEPSATVGQAQDCPCGTGAVCAGPRGGRYCARPDGGRSYIGK